jgi:hypothetical protein
MAQQQQQQQGSSLGEASSSLVEQLKSEISLLDTASQPHAIRLLNDGKLVVDLVIFVSFVNRERNDRLFGNQII